MLLVVLLAAMEVVEVQVTLKAPGKSRVMPAGMEVPGLSLMVAAWMHMPAVSAVMTAGLETQVVQTMMVVVRFEVRVGLEVPAVEVRVERLAEKREVPSLLRALQASWCR